MLSGLGGAYAKKMRLHSVNLIGRILDIRLPMLVMPTRSGPAMKAGLRTEVVFLFLSRAHWYVNTLVVAQVADAEISGTEISGNFGDSIQISSQRPAAKPPSPPPAPEETRKVAGKARSSDGLRLGYTIAPPAGRAVGVSRIMAAP
jgi:hypothetical protein